MLGSSSRILRRPVRGDEFFRRRVYSTNLVPGVPSICLGTKVGRADNDRHLRDTRPGFVRRNVPVYDGSALGTLYIYIYSVVRKRSISSAVRRNIFGKKPPGRNVDKKRRIHAPAVPPPS